MTFEDILHKFRTTSFTEKEKGTRFERIIRSWFLSDPRYNHLTDVWMWEDFPARNDFGGKDTGIDLVARTELGDFWAIQCKCYAETATIDKPAVDSFLATSSRTFTDPVTLRTVRFAARVWVSTASHWGANAEESLRNQAPPVNRINLVDLESSPVDWGKLLKGIEGKRSLRSGKQLGEHQLNAITAAHRHYIEEEHTRGKLIMACGTGKTYTSLKIVEALTGGHGLVLFMVPSIALLGQSLNEWSADAARPIRAVCICSDNKASRRILRGNEDDTILDSALDLAQPATTDARSVVRQLKRYRQHDGLICVFSTYQSVDAVSEAQRLLLKETDGAFGTFDFIICDEAHRTTGVKLSNADESAFTKIHSDENVRAQRRLYMTATPRLYGENAKMRASLRDCVLCSMDDEALYGTEFYRVNFSYAVQKGLLTDYKVLVLTVSESDLPDDIRADVMSHDRRDLNFDDTTKLIGVINGLSKQLRGDDGMTWKVDPRMMRRAVAFCSKIGDVSQPGTSKNVAATLPEISRRFNADLTPEQQEHTVHVAARHIDGSMNIAQRNELMQWLKADAADLQECRVLCNVRCLSEGVDVPALDSVIFLSSRNSQVDVVQSVGRVMRTFHRGQADEKKYGYIIIPIVVPEDVRPEDALNDDRYFAVVWDILNALRSHDDNFNAHVNSISLNKKKSQKVLVSRPGIGYDEPEEEGSDGDSLAEPEAEYIANQLELRFGQMQEGIYARLVEKCGDRMYWENWAKEVGLIAHKFIERISALVLKEHRHAAEFQRFLAALQKNINPSVDAAQAIEMLAQHMITRPVFDALFSEYNFVKNNAVSMSMQQMLDVLHDEAFEKDTAVLDRFYTSVKTNVGHIDNLEGKQTVIKNLYEKFFKGAFPKTVDKLGIVYTPVECVDFIIHSVDDILRCEFRTSLTEENVHILDPFTGTGTFVTRLLQSGLISPLDMERKYRDEIHCNEIVLLAYYIADVNIESVFHDLTHRHEYLNYDRICLTDTFQVGEVGYSFQATDNSFLAENTKQVREQNSAPVQVIIGNPPYSVGQKSANDNAQNLSYPHLDERIAETYATHSDATLKTSLYDSYIKAFRWASDRIAQNPNGGIVGFISNGAWIDGLAQTGFRYCLEHEFSSIYVLNLRGNQRTSGELSRREGGKIFGSGSRTPISITILVKHPNQQGKAKIHYHDIGDYLTREQKLELVKAFGSVLSPNLEWQIIQPNEKDDWINQRDGLFDLLIKMGDKATGDNDKKFFKAAHTNGILTSRDIWCYNYSIHVVANNMERMITFYNQQCEDFTMTTGLDVETFIETDEKKISWTRALRNDLAHNKKGIFDKKNIVIAHYRPFQKLNLYCEKQFNELLGIQIKAFPHTSLENLVICVTMGNHGLSALISDIIPDRHFCGDSQCFPLYYYEENKQMQGTLFDNDNEDKYIRRDGITDWILNLFRSRFSGARTLTKEMIFYYVYGILHSPEYRQRFADDLKKSLPRLPIVDTVEDFMAFYKAGWELAKLHLEYETVPPCPDCQVYVADYVETEAYTAYDHFRVTKMKFGKGQICVDLAAGHKHAKTTVDDRSVIIVNGNIRIENIPQEAYDYVVNGKSAIEWVMERYAVTIDKKSLIKNDPNDWAREHNQPRYILDLLLSVINVSVQTVRIVGNLPRLTFS